MDRAFGGWRSDVCIWLQLEHVFHGFCVFPCLRAVHLRSCNKGALLLTQPCMMINFLINPGVVVCSRALMLYHSIG